MDDSRREEYFELFKAAITGLCANPKFVVDSYGMPCSLPTSIGKEAMQVANRALNIWNNICLGKERLDD